MWVELKPDARAHSLGSTASPSSGSPVVSVEPLTSELRGTFQVRQGWQAGSRDYHPEQDSFGVVPKGLPSQASSLSLFSLRSYQWKPDPSVADSMMFAQMLFPKNCWMPKMPSESVFFFQHTRFFSWKWDMARSRRNLNLSLFQLPSKLGSRCNERIWETSRGPFFLPLHKGPRKLWLLVGTGYMQQFRAYERGIAACIPVSRHLQTTRGGRH